MHLHFVSWKLVIRMPSFSELERRLDALKLPEQMTLLMPDNSIYGVENIFQALSDGFEGKCTKDVEHLRKAVASRGMGKLLSLFRMTCT
jgi:hypothetical protein